MTGSANRPATSGVIAWTVRPMYGWVALPVVISCCATVLTVLIGMAKPIPTLPDSPVLPVEIAALTPTTSPASVDQRATRVARVDRGVGLDDVVDRLGVRRLDAALERAHDPGGDGARVAERIAERDHGVADADAVGVPERERLERTRFGADLQHRDIRRRIGPDDSRTKAVVVREADPDRGRVMDDVVVGQDVAVLREHEARAERLLLGQEPVRRPEDRIAGLRHELGGDLDDSGRVVHVDLSDRHPVCGGDARRRRRGRRLQEHLPHCGGPASEPAEEPCSDESQGSPGRGHGNKARAFEHGA